ncbi:hypothetical protein BH20ACI2_BH20ACI2_10320 [soil metagenome]
MRFVMKRSILDRLFLVITVLVLAASAAIAQKATVTLSLDEKFFDTLLDSVFQNFDPPEFAVAKNLPPPRSVTSNSPGRGNSFAGDSSFACSQTVKILREMSGVRTAVKFREGKVYVPLAFSGNYAPPFVGCVEFSGWAEANIDLEFDPNGQRLIGRARVFNVNLTGSGGIGGSLIARMLQSSIDKKLNPIEILTLDKLSFGVPVQRSGNLRMRAVGARPVMGNGVINIHIDYLFSKG